MKLLRLLLLHLLALLARPFVRPAPATIERVLYIKPDHLGDLLLATPVLAALREALPAAQITALVGPWSRMALQRNPHVDALLDCPFPGFERTKNDGGRTTNDERRTTNDERSSQRLLSRALRLLSPLLPFSPSRLATRLASLARPYLTLLRYAALLRAGRYDAALVGRDDHWWGAALALLAGVSLRVGFAVPECRPFLSTALPWEPSAHVTTQGLQLVAALPGAGTSSKTLPALFTPAPADRAWAAGWYAEHVAPSQRVVIIHPGTGGPSKLWLVSRWAAVADTLAGDPGLRLLLTGGPDEVALVKEIVARMRTAPLVLAGQTSVGQLAALMESADLVLGVDSGPLHLAAALGRATVHLYGPGDNGRFGPWGDPAQHVVLREPLWCAPCGVFSACPRGLAQPECMSLISVESVLGAARQLLQPHTQTASGG